MSGTMLACETSLVLVPDELTVEIEGDCFEILAVPEDGVDLLAVGGGGAGGEGVLLMDVRFSAARRCAPEDLAFGTDADHAAVIAVLAGGLQEDAVAPDYGRAVTDAWELAFPEDVLFGPLDRDVFV